LKPPLPHGRIIGCVAALWAASEFEGRAARVWRGMCVCMQACMVVCMPVCVRARARA